MEDVLGVLCGLTFAVALLAVIGHGIWLLFAWIGRQIFGKPQPFRDAEKAPKEIRPFGSRDDAVIDIRRRLVATALAKQLRGELSVATLQQFMDVLDESMPPPPEPLASQATSAEPREPIVAETVKPPVVHREPATAPPRPISPIAPEPAEVHPLDRVDEEEPAEVAAAPARPPAKPLSVLLQVFMEEKNIRWGEIVAGMLIVGSAVGLVVSLWATLKDTIPYFPALIFMLVTAAIYSAGIYTLRRWKLESTSRGLLIIAVLLIPLNFLAGIALSPEDRSATDPLYLLAVSTGVFAFGAIAVSASRALAGRAWPLLVIAVMGTSVSQLVVDRISSSTMSLWTVVGLGMLPGTAYLAALVGQLRAAGRWKRMSAAHAGQIFLVLGIATFALPMPLWLLVQKSASMRDTLSQLAPCLSLLCAAPLGLGLLVHRRVKAADLAATRTAGTAIAVLAAAMMVAMLFLAWPQPDLLIGVGVVNFLALSYIAFATRFYYLHIPAALSAALAILVGFHLFQENIPPQVADGSQQLMPVFLWGRSGIVLACMAALAAGAAEMFRRFGRIGTALGYLFAAGALASAGTLVALYAGFWTGIDAQWTTPLMAFVALATLAVGTRVPLRQVAWAGSALLLIAAIHALLFNGPFIQWLADVGMLPAWPLLAALILHAAVCTVFAAAARELLHNADDYVHALAQSALATSIVATPLILWVTVPSVGAHAAYALTVALVWLVLSRVLNWPYLFSAFQAMLAVSICFATTAICRKQVWWSETILDPRHVQAQLCTLAGSCAMWIGSLLIARRTGFAGPARQMRLYSIVPVLLQATVFGVAGLAVLGCMPGVTAEFGIIIDSSAVSPLRLVGELSTADLGILIFLVLGAVAALSCYALGSRHALGWAPLLLTWLFFVALGVSQLGPLVDHIWKWLGVPHTLAHGPGMWLAWALCAGALVGTLWVRFSTTSLANIVYLAAVVPLLVAARFEDQLASASALRWGLALCGILIAVAICLRKNWIAGAGRIGMPGWGTEDPQVVESLRTVGLLQVGLPVLLLTTGIVVTTAIGRPLGGPVADSIFAKIGPAVSYAGPLLLLAVALVAYAVRERTAEFALSASLLINLAVSVGMLIPHWISGAATTNNVLVALLQINTIAAAACGLLWLAATCLGSRHAPQELGARQSFTPLQCQIGLAMAGVIALAAWAFAAVFENPSALPSETTQLGNAYGLAALALAAVLAMWYGAVQWRRASGPDASLADYIFSPGLTVLIGIAGLSTAALAAAASGIWNTQANWFSYHVLTAGCVAVTAVLTILATVRRGRATTRMVAVCGCVVLALAVRGAISDPLAPRWSAGSAVTLSLLALVLGARLPSARWAWLSTILAAVATSFVAIGPWIGLWKRDDFIACMELIWANVTALALMGVIWILIALFSGRRKNAEAEKRTKVGFTIGRIVGIVLLFAVALVLLPTTSLAALARGFGESILIAGWPAQMALGSVALLLIFGLWDPRAHYALVRLYLLGVVLLFLYADYRQLELKPFVFELACATSVYLLATGLLWEWRKRFAVLAQSMGVPHVGELLVHTARWLPIANFILAAGVMLIGLVVVLTFEERWMRVGAAAAVAGLVPGIAMLAIQRSSFRMRYAALLIATVAVVYLGWATLPVTFDDAYWLRRAIRLTVAMATAAIAYGLVMVRIVPRDGDWFAAAGRAGAIVSIGSIVALVWTLVMEAVSFVPGAGAPVSGPELTQVIVVLVGLAGALVSMALLRGQDPLGLSEGGRMFYIYAAEVVLALLPVHIYLTMPELFHGRIRPFWPFIAMAIAYAGVTLSLLARRAGLRVLAEPLERTGALLPLLPALGFWVVDLNPNVKYYTTLLIAGVLYGALAFARRRAIYAAAAVVAGNATLWALLHEFGQSILVHPQFWLIPPALCALVAAQLNRHRLSAQQLTAIRYASAMVIYVSATGEIFISGVGQRLWPPMVLALLSVLGVLTGIFLRVRAFVYLGTAFVLLSIITMVWHAARNIGHVWPWWAFGIVLGLAILTMFGLFEKKRNEISGLLDDFRSWQP